MPKRMTTVTDRLACNGDNFFFIQFMPKMKNHRPPDVYAPYAIHVKATYRHAYPLPKLVVLFAFSLGLVFSST